MIHHDLFKLTNYSSMVYRCDLPPAIPIILALWQVSNAGDEDPSLEDPNLCGAQRPQSLPPLKIQPGIVGVIHGPHFCSSGSGHS